MIILKRFAKQQAFDGARHNLFAVTYELNSLLTSIRAYEHERKLALYISAIIVGKADVGPRSSGFTPTSFNGALY